MNRRAIIGQLVAFAAAITATSACQEESGSSCYPPSKWIDASGAEPGICLWWSHEDIPNRDYGDGVERHQIGITLEPEECNGCPGDEVDALIMAKIENECDQPVMGFMRGCYTTPKSSLAPEDACYYIAFYWSACDPYGSSAD